MHHIQEKISHKQLSQFVQHFNKTMRDLHKSNRGGKKRANPNRFPSSHSPGDPISNNQLFSVKCTQILLHAQSPMNFSSLDLRPGCPETLLFEDPYFFLSFQRKWPTANTSESWLQQLRIKGEVTVQPPYTVLISGSRLKEILHRKHPTHKN